MHCFSVASFEIWSATPSNIANLKAGFSLAAAVRAKTCASTFVTRVSVSRVSSYRESLRHSLDLIPRDVMDSVSGYSSCAGPSKCSAIASMLALSPPEDPAFPYSQREPTRGATSSRPSRGKEHWNDDPEKEHNMNFIMSDKPKRARMKVLLALLRAAALSCGLIIGLAPLCLAEAELNRQDPSLDAPSSRRPGAARGALISAQPLNTAAALPSAARNFLVLYNSRSPDDSDVVVSGTVSIPAGNPPAGGWPLITWTHGTTGLAPQCAPSSDTVDGPEHTYLSATQAMLDAFVRHGYVVVATDYQGFGAAGVQAYLVGMGKARSAIDIMRAARKVDLAV